MLSAKLIYRRVRVPDIKVLVTREVHRGYYDLLGLTPKASQTDIKNAYYKKSMLYHPDKGDGSPEKFREVTAAYEILGNLKLRHMYDKGLLPNTGGFTSIPKSETSHNKPGPPKPAADKDKARANQHFYQNVNSQAFDESLRKKQRTYTGKSAHYDFDAWTQAHYKEGFTRHQTAKRFERAKTANDTNLIAVDVVGSLIFFLFVGYIAYFMAWAKDGQDVHRQFKPKDN